MKALCLTIKMPVCIFLGVAMDIAMMRWSGQARKIINKSVVRNMLNFNFEITASIFQYLIYR